MLKLKNYLASIYRSIVNSIAFYPGLISIFGLILAILSLILDDYFKITGFFMDKAPYLIINNADTARSITSTLIAGLISLTVFSFSMVMILLNQASNNYSPRLLPGLISNRRHQIVLGFYLGSIIFGIFVLISILPVGDANNLPGFPVLLAIALGVTCLFLFVYFIHNISKEIQISLIIDRLFRATKARLLKLNELEERHSKEAPPQSDKWQVVKSQDSGYYQGYSKELLIEIAQEIDSELQILPTRGFFVLKGVPVIKSKVTVDEETTDKILSCLQFSNQEHVSENYLLGFKQITEVAVKAMSPGINDPGTAIIAIDYLTQLFSIRLLLRDNEVYADDTQQRRLIINSTHFSELLYTTMAALRQYCKHDIIISLKLAQMLSYLRLQDTPVEKYRESIEAEAGNLLEDAERNIKNEIDLQRLRKELHLN